ncbi:MAG: M55 family metallopeptidase [Synergistaceae bacterium]|jgi:D-amino peptidase|nr:M55 family metallopeptidase [Synergistaceae bacterium]
MRVYISVDAEGCTGIFKLAQVMSENGGYDFCRRMMEGDANAAISGAFRAGASEVIVNDAHNSGDNIRIDNLDRRARLISGGDRQFSMMEGISPEFGAAMFIGYHNRKGGGGVISHTYYYSEMQEVRINGTPVGESEINGLLAGSFGVPLVFLSGDQYAAENIKAKVPGIRTAVTKKAIGYASAECVNPEITWKLIEEEVYAAISGLRTSPIKPMSDPPYALEIQFATPGHANRASLLPGSRRVSPTTVGFEAADYSDIFRAFLCLITLASTFNEYR